MGLATVLRPLRAEKSILWVNRIKTANNKMAMMHNFSLGGVDTSCEASLFG